MLAFFASVFTSPIELTEAQLGLLFNHGARLRY